MNNVQHKAKGRKSYAKSRSQTHIGRAPVLARHSSLFICLFLLLITVALYQQITDHEFILDDELYVAHNHYIQRGITLESIVWAFTFNHAANWHPLTWLSHIIDYQLFGLNPGRHHLANVFLHVVNTLLLFCVLKKMSHALWQSAFVAALFAIHPLHVESVAWVAERKDVLSTFFWLLTMWAYLLYVKHRGIKRYIPVALFFALGLMAKPMVVTLPMVLLLMDYWPLKRFQFRQPGGLRLVMEKMPLFAFSAACCILTYWAQQTGGAVGSLNAYPLDVRTANALISYVLYLAKMIWPLNLAVFYPYPQAFVGWQVAGACLLLMAVSLLTIIASRQYPYLIVGWLWYIGTLVPVIGLVQVGMQAMADRYTYVPLIGIFMMIAWGVPDLLGRWRFKTAGLCSVTIILLILLSATTYIQIQYWKNALTLYKRSIRVTKNNFVLHENLGLVFAKQGRTTEAIIHLQETLRINPRHVNAHYNLGLAFLEQGNALYAVKYLQRTLELDPRYKNAHYILGLALLKQGKTVEAVKHFQEELRINPNLVDAYNDLGLSLVNLGRTEEAITSFETGLRIDPGNPRTYNNLGFALIKKGLIEEAIVQFDTALEINPHLKDVRLNRDMALNMLKETQQSRQ